MDCVDFPAPAAAVPAPERLSDPHGATLSEHTEVVALPDRNRVVAPEPNTQLIAEIDDDLPEPHVKRPRRARSHHDPVSMQTWADMFEAVAPMIAIGVSKAQAISTFFNQRGLNVYKDTDDDDLRTDPKAVCLRTAMTWLERMYQTGVAQKYKTGRPRERILTDEDVADLLNLLKCNSKINNKFMAEYISKKKGLEKTISTRTIQRALQGKVRQKAVVRVEASVNTAEKKTMRLRFATHFCDLREKVGRHRIVFIDETECAALQGLDHGGGLGRAPPGVAATVPMASKHRGVYFTQAAEPAPGLIPSGRSNGLTVTFAMTCQEIVLTWTCWKRMTKMTYIEFIESLLQTLKNKGGQWLIVHDNDSSHNVDYIFKKPEYKDNFSLLQLPTASPWMNPVEYLNHSIKERATGRLAATGSIQTAGDLQNFVGMAIQSIPPQLLSNVMAVAEDYINSSLRYKDYEPGHKKLTQVTREQKRAAGCTDKVYNWRIEHKQMFANEDPGKRLQGIRAEGDHRWIRARGMVVNGAASVYWHPGDVDERPPASLPMTIPE